MRNSAMICLVFFILGGCGGGDTYDLQQPFTASGVHFALTPSAARDCDPETLYEAVVNWRIDRPQDPRIEIRLESGEGPLFARSNDGEGSVRTGPWVRRGMWFLLVDRDSGELLAAQRAGPESCD